MKINFLMVLKAGKSKVEGPAAGEDLCAASSHSGRMKGQGHLRAIL